MREAVLMLLAKRRAIKKPILESISFFTNNGALGRIRTSDRLVRSQVLYPAELRARLVSKGSAYPVEEAHITDNLLSGQVFIFKKMYFV